MDEDQAVELYLQLVQNVIDNAKLTLLVNANLGSLTSTGPAGSTVRYCHRELGVFCDPRLSPPPPTYPVALQPQRALRSALRVP